MVVENANVQVRDFSPLAIGDLVFFDADTDDGTQIDHAGIYLGPDSKKNHRFISSRKRANGPTLGDAGGKSILNGSGLYARSFRAVRRV
jgi:cell wall-associated NlpC family hydrolase